MSIPATMRALQQTSLNGPQDLLLITDAPVPVPGPGEVLIRITAAGVNFVDVQDLAPVDDHPAQAGVEEDLPHRGRTPFRAGHRGMPFAFHS